MGLIHNNPLSNYTGELIRITMESFQCSRTHLQLLQRSIDPSLLQLSKETTTETNAGKIFESRKFGTETKDRSKRNSCWISNGNRADNPQKTSCGPSIPTSNPSESKRAPTPGTIEQVPTCSGLWRMRWSPNSITTFEVLCISSSLHFHVSARLAPA